MSRAIVCLLLFALPVAAQAVGKLSLGGPIGPGGVEVTCDLPVSERKRNIGSPPPNGPGCCVFRSLDHASRWQNVPALYGFPEWMVKNGVVGGGYPQKVDQLIPRISKDRGLPTPAYLQYSGKDFATVIKAALATGRMPCITYAGHDPHYRGLIDHMVNCILYDEKADVAAILDNNFVGKDELVYMTCAELRQRCSERGGGWVVVLLPPPPPPVPSN